MAATGDWTKDTPRVEYPAVRRIYGLFNAESRVHAVQFDAPHNYNRNSREAVYSWMARWLQQAPEDAHVTERPFTPERLPDLLVFHGRPLPDEALTVAQITEQWIASAKERAKESRSPAIQSALIHALAFDRQPAHETPPSNVVVLAGGVAQAGDDLFTPLRAEVHRSTSRASRPRLRLPNVSPPLLRRLHKPTNKPC